MIVLIASTDPVLSQVLPSSLRMRGHVVAAAASWPAAEAMLVDLDSGIVIIDLAMAPRPGDDAVRRMRARQPSVPILAIATDDEPSRRVEVLEGGADDCLGRSFSIDELMARVGVWSRRLMGTARRFVGVGPLTLDSRSGSVTFKGRTLGLTRRESLIRAMLLRRRGQPVSKEQILEELEFDGQSLSLNTLEVAVHRLRQKLPAGEVRIATMRGVGYSLEQVSR